MTQVPFSPIFMYGTAWKEDRTADLVTKALVAGFRAIDTANQRKHYFEVGVGEALKSAYAEGHVQRQDLFLQSKFTYKRGQDHRLPYNPNDALSQQVEQSFASSLEHLDTEYLDSYVLHGPASSRGLTADDREVWHAMEKLHRRGAARHLGISNISLEQLEQLLTFATIKPTFVQNRCFAELGWDSNVRSWCTKHDVIYQGFSLLTANPEAIASPLVSRLAAAYKATPSQIIFRFAQQIGMCPLTGTSKQEHMTTDLECDKINLSAIELTQLERVHNI